MARSCPAAPAAQLARAVRHGRRPHHGARLARIPFTPTSTGMAASPSSSSGRTTSGRRGGEEGAAVTHGRATGRVPAGGEWSVQTIPSHKNQPTVSIHRGHGSPVDAAAAPASSGVEGAARIIVSHRINIAHGPSPCATLLCARENQPISRSARSPCGSSLPLKPQVTKQAKQKCRTAHHLHSAWSVPG